MRYMILLILCCPWTNGLVWFQLQKVMAKNKMVEIESLKEMQCKRSIGVST